MKNEPAAMIFCVIELRYCGGSSSLFVTMIRKKTTSGKRIPFATCAVSIKRVDKELLPDRTVRLDRGRW